MKPPDDDEVWEYPMEGMYLYLVAGSYDSLAGRFEKLPHYDLITKVTTDKEREFICMKDGRFFPK